MRVALPLLQFWNRVPGGTATAAVGLIKATARISGIELVGIIPRGCDPPVELEGLPIEWATIPADRRWMPLPTQLKSNLHLALLYEGWSYAGLPSIEAAIHTRFGTTVDLIHFTAPLVPRTGTLPITATVHDLFPVTLPTSLTKRGARLMGRSIATLRDRAVGIACSSETTRRACLDFGFDANKLVVAPLGVDIPDSGNVGAQAGRERPYVLWVGTVEPRKNLAAVLSLAEPLARADRDLVLVGPDGWAAAGDLVRGASHDHANVKWLGHVSATERDVLYAGADVFVFPSFEEGFGMPVLEAMACGTPVVTSRGTATEDAAQGAAVLVDPHDSAELADCVLELIASPHRRSQLVSAGRARANECTWDACAALTVAMWDSALNASHP